MNLVMLKRNIKNRFCYCQIFSWRFARTTHGDVHKHSWPLLTHTDIQYATQLYRICKKKNNVWYLWSPADVFCCFLRPTLVPWAFKIKAGQLSLSSQTTQQVSAPIVETSQRFPYQVAMSSVIFPLIINLRKEMLKNVKIRFPCLVYASLSARSGKDIPNFAGL